MREAEWLASYDTTAMYYRVSPWNSQYNPRGRRFSRRVASLFAVACIRATPQARRRAFLKRAAEVVERVADEEDAWPEVDALEPEARRRCSGHVLDSPPHYWALVAFRLVAKDIAFSAMHVPLFLCDALVGSPAAPDLRRAYAEVLRDVAGNPFRGGRGKRLKKPSKLRTFPVLSDSHVTSDVLALARGMYESRDFSAMPILADALQDAGCDGSAILDHCRDTLIAHVRGCWVVDLVLGKS